jgi:protein-disulfide isomerase
MESSSTLDGRLAPLSNSDHSLGSPDARVTIIEYGEFECPHCGRAHFHLKQLRDRFDELEMRLVFRHLARDEVHPFSERAAITAEAAAKQDRFWDMHDHLFENQHALELDDLRSHAQAIGLDVDRFVSDLSDEALVEKVRNQGAQAIAAGIDSTPTFFINQTRYEGSYDARSLGAAVKRALRTE